MVQATKFISVCVRCVPKSV